MKHNCPICHKPVDSTIDPDFPFCSERCRLLDLGNWAAEKYVVSDPIFDEEELSVDFDLEPGQIQFVHNRALGHSRTTFIDDPDPDRRRHLVRLWLRDYGRRAYQG